MRDQEWLVKLIRALLARNRRALLNGSVRSTLALDRDFDSCDPALHTPER